VTTINPSDPQHAHTVKQYQVLLRRDIAPEAIKKEMEHKLRKQLRAQLTPKSMDYTIELQKALIDRAVETMPD
jgi:predicted phage-related endonuclease